LDRRIAFVAGGAGAIGRAIATRFAKSGAHVVIADLEERAAQGATRELNDQFGAATAQAVRLDVTDEESVLDALRETVLAYGGLDIVVSSAGYATSHPVEDMPLDEWRRTYDVLVTGTFLLVREAVAVMRQQRVDGERALGGSIVFLASKAGLAPGNAASAYASAKAAVLHFARTLAEEVGGDSIRVNSLAPDAIIEGSGLWAGQWGEARAQAHGVSLEDLPEVYRQRNALKVNVTAEDVAEAALFFASDRAKAITGAVLTVDGGLRDAYVR
jgi:NAD(P)-dependent dehydrogenase (short-subunit alcohol dehydrogenase family)